MPFESTPWARQDAYAVLPFSSQRATTSDLHAGSITFLDLVASDRPIETIAGYLDAVPAWLLARPSALLIRWLEEGARTNAGEAVEYLAERLRSRNLSVPVGLIRFAIGTEPSIAWDSQTAQRTHGVGINDADLLYRARRVEVGSYLEWGRAVWRPSGYHYQFPSGRHARVYVRVADGFTDIRAAAAMATWLYRHIQPDATSAVVVDTGTLGPLVTELRAAASSAGAAIDPVIGIDNYPRSPLPLQQRLLKATDGLPVLGLVSVSDTGTLASQLASVLNQGRSGAVDVVVEQLVARGLAEGTSIEPLSGGVADPWIALGNPGGVPAEPPCEACGDPDSARLVYIDPRSMAAMVLPKPELLMPDLTDARRNASLWEAYEQVKARRPHSDWVGLAGPTGTRLSPDGTLDAEEQGVFFEPAQLLLSTGVIGTRRRELSELPARHSDDPEKKRILAARDAVGNEASVVVIDEVERGLFSDQEWEHVRHQLSPFVSTEASYFRFSGSGPEVTVSHCDGGYAPAEPPSVLIVALGLRTGVTLHRMFLAARQQWPSAEHRGVVIHAHPHDDRVWASARNTFTDSRGKPRLLALWLTYMPLWSPFSEELDLLNSFPAKDLSEDVHRTLQQRRDDLKQIGGPKIPFWGPTDQQLQKGSYFGEELEAASTCAAVGSSLQGARLRKRSRGAPHWTMVDLPRTFRSFFDGLIHASVLRWTRTEECWWGEQEADAVQLIMEMQHQMAPHWPLILPELLLAGLQGKLPSAARQHVVEDARDALRRSRRQGGIADDRSRDFLAFGLELYRVGEVQGRGRRKARP